MREDTPLPFATANAGVTQELDPNDILEVQDMAAAIARAEKLVAQSSPRSSQTLLPAAEPSSGHDLFESLGHRPHAPARPTDDIVGPAMAAPAGVPTPIPPAYAEATPAAPVVAQAPAPAITRAPPAPASVPRYVTMPSATTGIEEDAFYHPMGRMRSLADITLDGYRPEPTLLVRAASRRKRFSWLFVAALLPLLVLAAIAISAYADPAASPIVTTRTPSLVGTSKLSLATTSTPSKSVAVTAAPEPAPKGAKPAAGTPTFDVNSLPPARTRR